MQNDNLFANYFSSMKDHNNHRINWIRDLELKLLTLETSPK